MRLKGIIAAILANITAAMSEILLMASAGWLIASAALQPPLSALSVGITLVRTAGILRAVLRYADRFLSHKVIFEHLDDLRGKIFMRAAKMLPMKSGIAYEGEFLHSLTIEAELRKDILPRVILPMTTSAIVTLLLTYFLGEVILPVIFIINVVIAWHIEEKTADDSDYRGKILDLNSGREELKIYGTNSAIKILDKLAKEFGEENLSITARKIEIEMAFRILNVAGMFFILMNLSAVVDRISLTVWSLILLATLEIFVQIPSAIGTWKKIRRLKAYKVNNLTPAQNLKTNYAVEIRNLDFGYNGEKIFDNFSLKIERGEKIAIVGESGAGKTTLLYLLTKLFAPDSGKIGVNGTIGAATFNNYIFSSSIRANFEILHGNITEEEIFNALRISGLENVDIDANIGENGWNLSGGERNRLQIALALAKGAEILILDEPTAGLDRVRAEKLVEKLIEATKNRTLIVITHDSNYFLELGRVGIIQRA